MTAPVLTAARKTVEGFSVTHAAILDGTVTAAQSKIFSVNSASLAPDQGSVDNPGDDRVQSTWNWLNFATLTVESGFIGFDVLAKLSGTTIDESLDGTEISLPLWQVDAGNQPPWPVLVRMASKDRARHTLFLDFVLFSVQFGPITFQGPAYKTGLKASYVGKALISDFDETGVALPPGKEAIGRIVSTVIA